ncbi:uncharacterized protein Bfra_012208, partial [Botrytis fragariae]
PEVDYPNEPIARETNSRFWWTAEIKATALLSHAIITLRTMALGPLPLVRLAERIGLDEVVAN